MSVLFRALSSHSQPGSDRRWRRARAGGRAGRLDGGYDAARDAQSQAAAAARPSGCQGYAGQGIVCPQADAVSRPGARHWRVCGRLHGRRGAIADHRADLAGDAAVAQSQLGQSGTHQVHRAARQERQEGRLERTVNRRHGAAARRPDDFRPRQPSDRPRCRYLADADAGPRADARRARDGRRRQHGRPRAGSTSITSYGRRHAPLCSRPPRKIQRPCASSSMRRSKRKPAPRPERTAPGSPSCGRGGVTPNIFTSGWSVRPTARNARRSRPCRRATAAATRSTIGSSRASCIRHRRRCRPRQST